MTPRKPDEEKERWRRKEATPAQLEYVDSIRKRCKLDPADLDRWIGEHYGDGRTLADLNRGQVSSLIERIDCWKELTPRVLELRGQQQLPM
jgi:hypothetical protein